MEVDELHEGQILSNPSTSSTISVVLPGIYSEVWMYFLWKSLFAATPNKKWIAGDFGKWLDEKKNL